MVDRCLVVEFTSLSHLAKRLMQQLSYDFGISLRLKRVALFDQLLLELLVVLDHAVVDQSQIGKPSELWMTTVMGVGVGFRRRSVSCPACMTDPYATSNRLTAHQRFEIRNPTNTAASLQDPIVPNEAQTCAVVSTILQTVQALEKEFRRV
jgi:hypothetical protein